MPQIHSVVDDENERTCERKETSDISIYRNNIPKKPAFRAGVNDENFDMSINNSSYKSQRNTLIMKNSPNKVPLRKMSSSVFYREVFRKKVIGVEKVEYNFLLNFTDSKNMKKYSKFRRDIDPNVFWVTCVIVLVGLAPRSNLQNDFDQQGFFIGSFLCVVITILGLFTFILMRCTLLTFGRVKEGGLAEHIGVYVNNKLFFGDVESVLSTSCNLAIFFLMIGRVMAGPCAEENETILESTTCNSQVNI